MNLFLLHINPKLLASRHCDKHIVKMILETAQLLYTAWWVNHGSAPTPQPYKSTHAKHPLAIWVRKCEANYAYTIQVGLELCYEYTRRYNKVHKSQEHIELLQQFGYPNPSPGVLNEDSDKSIYASLSIPPKCTPFPLAMPDDCVIYNPVCQALGVESYIAYYKYKYDSWSQPMKWSKQPTVPEWLI